MSYPPMIFVYSVKDRYNRHIQNVEVELYKSPHLIKYIKQPLLFEEEVRNVVRKTYPDFEDSQLIVYFEYSIEKPLF